MPYRVDLTPAEAGPDRDSLAGTLIELGALDLDDTPDGGLAALIPDHVSPRQVARTLGLPRISRTPVDARDDGSVWALRLRPVQVGPHTLQLTDTRAFGTGQHPTTALCLEAIADAVAYESPDTLLDVGTGSGILALGALRLGVARATGIDLDPAAFDAAAANARLNELSDRIDLVTGGPEAVTGSWPLVVANVLAAPLIEMAGTLVRRVGHHGRLILSGIPASAADEVERAYVRLGMRALARRERGGWVALELRAGW